MILVSTHAVEQLESCLPSQKTAQRAKLLQQIEYYVNESGVEQQIGLRDELPTLQEYKQRRMGTSAVYVFLALTESVSIACPL